MRQNRILFLILIIIFVLFTLILYIGGNKIYEREERWQHSNTVAQLLSGREIIEVLFSDFAHDLFFLRDLPNTESYVYGDFKSSARRSEVKKAFYVFAKNHDYYYQIRIIDSSGYERVRVDNKRDNSTLIISDGNLQNKKHRYHFQETMELNNNQTYISPIDLNIERKKIEVPYVPVVRLATPLFDSSNKKKGILILNIYFSKVFKLLTGDMFIQTEEGNLISSNPDGSINFRKSSYDFSDRSGLLSISDVETVHYSTIDLLSGKSLVVGIYHKHPLLKVALLRLVSASVILLVLFLCLVLVIIHVNVSRLKELIGAQKVIIFSLAELTEYRDPVTGHHLQRVRNYSAALAKQLHKNEKYRRIITGKFIEDLDEAAPLHDIGKVGIRDSILLKESKLSDEEYEEMKMHVQIGKKILENILERFTIKPSFFIMGRNICAYHHEKYNGKGYAENLKGQEIPLEARVFALCDAYDAIRSRRPYESERSHGEAVNRIKSASGEHFDPDIVSAFLKCEREFLEISNVYEYKRNVSPAIESLKFHNRRSTLKCA